MKPVIGKKNRQFKQGIFTPKYPDKYRGSLPIYYRSNMELKVLRMLDNNSNIITYGSESVVIPYTSPLDNRLHRYFVDMVAALKDKEGNIKKLLIEVKPLKQTQPPVFSNRKSNKTLLYENKQYALNMAKFSAAKQWCEKNNYTFLILTEREIAPN
jgi:hypothetical protein